MFLALLGLIAIAPSVCGALGPATLKPFPRNAPAAVAAPVRALSVTGTLWTVNSIADSSDGVCDVANCTLREAMSAAQAGDTIAFSSLFNKPQTIAIGSALPAVNSDLTITGPGANLLTVRANDGGNYTILSIGSGTVNLSGLTITNAHANFAGGIGNFGTLYLTDSVISGNHAVVNGGGIHNAGTLVVTGSTISGNTAGSDGGGLFNYTSLGFAGAAVLVNSTLSANSSTSGRGAISNVNFDGAAPSVTLTNCTVSGNTGPAGTIASYNVGGGATTTLKNTLIANNSVPSLVAVGADAQIISLGNNLSTDNGNGFLVGPGDAIDTDAKLTALGYYGGRTPTHLLKWTSPAIDGGNNSGAPATDQRGVARPNGGVVDIGAVELNPLLVTVASDPGDGICDETCTLRDAISAANAQGVLADIEFDAAAFASPRTIKLASALPTLTGKLNLAGTGSDLLEVRRDSGGDYSVFDAEGGASVSISGMTIANGAGTSAGGILNVASTMNLANVVVSGNSSSLSFSGGGIKNGNGTLTITDSVVSLNQGGTFAGGGISNQAGTLTVTNTLVTRNTAQAGSGGIFNASGRIVVSNSTISSNSVASGLSGGGLYSDNYNAGADVTLVNTTLSGNSAGAGSTGSAIMNYGISSASVSNLTLSFCTLADNHGPATVLTISAGFAAKANTVLGNSIFSNGPSANLAASGAGASIISNGNNLASDSGNGLLTGGSDILNTDPGLTKLGNYGGPTPTHALMTGSPAVNAGNDAGAPGTDQRGGLRLVGAHVDIGAVEMNPRLVNSSSDPGDGACDGSCTLRDAVLAANAAGGTLVDIGFDPTAFASPQTINLGSALPDITGSVDVIGTGANRLTVRRNSVDPYSVFTIGAGASASLSGLTVANGQASDSGVGGGIYNEGVLTLARMAIEGNQAPSGRGGGIYNGGTLTIEDSTISNNMADDGAGMFNGSGFAHLINTTISGNDSGFNFTGGITNLNSASGPAFTSLLNSTIVNNVGGSEGGLYTSLDALTKIRNTIVAGNSLPNINGEDGFGTISLGNNLANDDGTGFLTNTGDLINLPALLAPLAYNGGSTKTHDPLAGSPAVSAGNPAGAPLTDQRGYPRPFTAHVDIGAVESDVLFRDGFIPL